MVEVYDSSRELVKIGPCRWTPNNDMAFWLSQDDETILQVWKPSLLMFEHVCKVFHQNCRMKWPFSFISHLVCPSVFVHVSICRTSSLCPSHQIHHPVSAGSSDRRRAVFSWSAASVPPCWGRPLEESLNADLTVRPTVTQLKAFDVSV